MGMSASQVRFLSLQHRKHDVGRQLTTLANRKMALSRDMNRVSKNYTNALNQTKLQWSNDCGNTYNPLSYDLMMKPNDINAAMPYIITDKQGRVVVDDQKFYFDKELGEIVKGETLVDGKTIGMSYKEIAAMISSFSGIDKTNGKPQYENFTRLNEDYTGTGTPVTRNGNFIASVDSSATAGLSSADGHEYGLIADCEDLGYENNFRYDIMTKLGLMSEQEQREYKSTVNELYGSEEAKESERYPVGSAWGDYYIAVANKNAYEEFVRDDNYHKLAISSMTNGTSRTSCSDAYITDDYQYNAEIHAGTNQYGADNSYSKITYSKKDPIEHVDFTTVMGTIDDECVAINSTSTDWATWAARYSAGNTNYDNTYTDMHRKGMNANCDGIDYDDLYEIDLYETVTDDGTKKLALQYINTIDDIVNKALLDQNLDYLNPDDQNASANWWLRFLGLNGGSATVLYKGDDNGKSRGEHDGVINEYYMAANNINGQCYDAIGNPLSQIVNFFTGQMELAGAKINDDALYKAVEAVKVRFGKGTADDDTDSCNVGDSALNDAANLTTSMVNRQQWHLDWSGIFPSWHRARWAAGVDMTSMFNCLMTYYSLYNNNSVVGDGSSNTVNPPVVSVNPPDIANPPATTYSKVDNNIVSKRTGVCNGKTTVSGMTQKIENTCYDNYIWNNEDIASAGWMIIDGGQLTTVYGHPGVDCYKISPEIDIIANYFQDYEHEWLEWQRSETETVSVIGTAQKYIGTITKDGVEYNKYNIYYFDNSQSDKLESFINSNYTDIGLLAGLGSDHVVEVLEKKVNTTGGTETFEDSPLSIQGKMTDSSFEIEMDARVKAVNQYRSQLQNKVDLAKDRIEQLEMKLDNIFSSVETKLMDYIDVICKRMSQQGWVYDEKINSSNATASNKYLNAMLENNQYFVTEAREIGEDQKYQYTMKQATSIKKIYQVHDTNAENIALAEYEAEKTLIASKEKKIDMRMNQLETEQEVINTELDSIKKIKEDNINTYFKIFA